MCEESSLVQALREFLGMTGRKFFNQCLRLMNTVSPVLTPKQQALVSEEEFIPEVGPGRPVPHPVHFRDGMQVRNFLRTREECKGWSDIKLDDTWAKLVERAIDEPCGHCVDPEGVVIFPYYGKEPHDFPRSRTLSKEQWPCNYKEDPEQPGCGIYEYCLHCGFFDRGREVDPADGPVAGPYW